MLGGVDATAWPRVDLTFRVQRGATPVTDGDTGHYHILDGGVPVTPVITCPERHSLQAALALGVERSLADLHDAGIDAARRLLRACSFHDQRTRASLWTFATYVSREIATTFDSTRLVSAVNSISESPWPFNGTALYEAMHRAIEDVNEFGATPSKAVVFVTDGINNTANYDRSEADVIGRALIDGIRVFVLGVGDKPDGIASMQRICTATGGFYAPASDAGACDSIIRAITLQPAETYWCHAVWNDPGCPNGATRTISFLHDPHTGDRDSARIACTAPRIEAQLTALPFWISPPTLGGAVGDTLETAVGITSASPIPVDSLRITMRHDGLRQLGIPWIDPVWSGWQIALQPSGDESILTMRPPPASGGIPAGQTRIVRMSLVRVAAGATDPGLSRIEGVDCRVLTYSGFTRGGMAVLDTVSAPRGGHAALTLRLAGNRVPEGIRSIEVEIVMPRQAAGPVVASAMRVQPLAGWELVEERVETHRDSIALMARLRSATPAMADAAMAEVLIGIDGTSPPFVPVGITVPLVNIATAGAVDVTRPGLVVVRDSCFNDVIALSGLAVVGPHPQPVDRRAHIEIRRPEPALVRLEVRDALGQLCQPTRTVACGPAPVTVTIDASSLSPGLHLVTVTDGTDVRSVSFIVTH